MSSPTAWTLSLCTSISLLLGATAMLTPDSRQEAKSAPTAASSKASEIPAKAAARRAAYRDAGLCRRDAFCRRWVWFARVLRGGFGDGKNYLEDPDRR